MRRLRAMQEQEAQTLAQLEAQTKQRVESEYARQEAERKLAAAMPKVFFQRAETAKLAPAIEEARRAGVEYLQTCLQVAYWGL